MAKKKPKLSLTTLLRTARAHSPLFISRENARFVTIGLKEKEGKLTDQLAIKIYVSEKQAPNDIDAYSLFPKEVQALAAGGKTLQGTIPTDVVHIGKIKFKLLGLRGGEQFYIQSVKVNGSCAILDNNGYIVTNSHVAAELGTDATNSDVNVIYNGAMFNGSIYKMSVIRPTGNRMDAATISISLHDPADMFVVTGCGAIVGPTANLSDGGTYEYFSGSDHVILSNPEPTTHPISFQLQEQGHFYGFDGFYNLQVDASSPNLPQEGHSGSLLVKNIDGNWQPAGLVFALAETTTTSRSLVCVYAWNDVVARVA